MQRDNNIENKLRLLDEQQQPDLGNMDNHWEQMRGMLKPAEIAARQPLNKVLVAGASVLAIVVVAILCLILNNNNPVKKIESAATKAPVKTEIVVPVKDSNVVTPPAIKINQALIPKTQTKAADPGDYFNEIDSAVASMKINFTPCETCPDKKVDSGFSSADSGAVEVSNQLKLQQFLNEVQSPEQEFIINNDRDTSLVCSGGTIVMVPAVIFKNNSKQVAGEVKIVIREFYNYEDIVSNKLSTVSNGEQLVSGGMLYISAMQKNEELQLAPAKQIAVKMPARGKFDEDMQLFTPANSSTRVLSIFGNSSIGVQNPDTADKSFNWQPAGQFQLLNRNRFMVKTFDPYGQPYKTYEKKDGSSVAKFMIRRNCIMNNEDVLKGLKGHFGMFYNTIKLKRSWSNNPKQLFTGTAYPVVGDSVFMDFAIAKRLNLLSKPEIEKYETLLLQDSISTDKVRKATPFYQFQLSQLGFMNCDRFSRDGRPKRNFTFNFGDGEKAASFFSVLAFDNYRSVIQGEISANRLRFVNLPLDEKVHIISIGVKDGKVVSCIQPYSIQTAEISDLKFTETTSKEFKERLISLQLQ